MGGWENARPFYFFFEKFWKEIIIYKTFLTGEKKMLEKEKEKERGNKKKKENQPTANSSYIWPCQSSFCNYYPRRDLGHDLGFPVFN